MKKRNLPFADVCCIRSCTMVYVFLLTFFTLFVLSRATAQGGSEGVVKGKVSDADSPLRGVTVKVAGTSTSTTTDEIGNYAIRAAGNATLVFTYTGYGEQRIPVGNRSTIHVTMVVDQKEMEAVVVTGYRTQAKGTITGSVSSVNSSEFANVPVDNLSNALAGRLSGVSVNQAAGTPGMESSIKIRNMGNYNNAEPLFVIDGVVSDKFAFDGLAPNEVEQITILKDGASAAIYGSRSANGVVLVTTKRGKSGAPKLSYNGIFGLQQPTKVPERLNAYEHASAINQQLRYISVPASDPRYYTADELEYFQTHSWDWVEEMWKDPATTQHSMDVSGGSQNVKYFLGGSYNYATGTFNNLDFSKLTLRGNVDVSVTRNLKVSLDLNTDNRAFNGPSWQVDNWRQEDLYKALMMRPAMVPPYVNGEPVGNWVEWHPGVVVEPSKAGYNRRRVTGLNSTATILYTFPFIKGLSAKVYYNRYDRDRYTKQFNLPYNMTLFNTTGANNHIVGDQATGIRPRAAEEFLLSRFDKEKRYQFNAQLNYKQKFGAHNVEGLFVYEQAEGNEIWFNGRRNDFISPAIDQYVAGSTVNASVNGQEEEIGRLSYVGLASYSYADKYLLDASFRFDGSAIFATGNRWSFFPSASAGWRISQEPFFKPVSFVSDLKLRASVGLLGDDRVDPYQWIQTYAIQPGGIFGTPTTGLQQGVLANPFITWEKTLNYNAGLDGRFLKDRVNFKLDLFYRHSYDILGAKQAVYPSTLGASMPDENYQVIDGRGFEVELGYNGQAGSSKNELTYYARANFGYATTEIIKVDEPENLPSYWSAIGRPVGLQGNGNMNRNGFYSNDMLLGYVATGLLRTQADLDALPAGYTILGVKPQLGMLNYQDIRGINSDKPDGKITAEDREFLWKHSIPPMNYGLSLGGAWKSLSLDLLFQGTAGAKAMLPTAGRDIQARAEESSFRYWADSWSPENPGGKYPGYRVTNYRTRFDPSSFWLVDNSFLRLKNLNISYALPQSLTSGVNLKNVRVFFTGTNLLMLYSANDLYDPEMNSILSYPMMKSYSFGINVGL